MSACFGYYFGLFPRLSLGFPKEHNSVDIAPSSDFGATTAPLTHRHHLKYTDKTRDFETRT